MPDQGFYYANLHRGILVPQYFVSVFNFLIICIFVFVFVRTLKTEIQCDIDLYQHNCISVFFFKYF